MNNSGIDIEPFTITKKDGTQILSQSINVMCIECGFTFLINKNVFKIKGELKNE